MNLFDVAIASKLSGGGGGGGSSDFSTATLSITNSGHPGVVVYPSIVDMGGINACVANQSNSSDNPIVLYQGNAGVMVQADSYTVSGNATDMGDGMVLVTGDCTIALT